MKNKEISAGGVRMKALVMVIGMSIVALAAGAQGKYNFPTEVKPLIATQWGQGAPYNLYCPLEKNDTTGTRHVLAGCGPLVMSQTVRHFRFPGTAHYIGSRYDYAKMFTLPTDSTTDEERQAVARLVRDCGTAAGTQYGQTASSTKLNSVIRGLKEYFGFNRYMNIDDRKFFPGRDGSRAWKRIIYDELKSGRPVIMRAERSKRNAHVFIIDGCRDSLVHVNWGWAGKRDGYYDPDSLYGYRYNQRMITGVSPDTYVPSFHHIHVRQPGQLARELNESDWFYSHHLQVSGTINGDDIATLRQLCGGGRGGERDGNVSSLDLRKAVILVMPKKAFYGCENLTYVALPETLPEISDYAFAKCEKLNMVVMGKMVGGIGSRAFFGCFNLYQINLPVQLRAIGSNAFNSCSALRHISIPKGTQVGFGAFAHTQVKR